METKTLRSAVVIKVNDFTLCDNFYRDVLGLGDPEFTSSHRHTESIANVEQFPLGKT